MANPESAKAIELFGFLVLSYLGIIVPLFILLLSMFPEGVQQLIKQYESEKQQSENNIKEQLNKLDVSKESNIKDIKKSLRELERIKRTAESKLAYLKPKRQSVQLFLPLIISFLGIIMTLLSDDKVYYISFISLGVICFILGNLSLWKSLNVIIEIRKVNDANKQDAESKNRELLTSIASKETEYILKKISIHLDNIRLNDKTLPWNLKPNEKKELEVMIHNSETRMAKTVEIGFIFPLDYLIEKSKSYSIITDEKRQIVRFKTDFIQAGTLYIAGKIIMTPLIQGNHKVHAFIKGENIEPIYNDIAINVE